MVDLHINLEPAFLFKKYVLTGNKMINKFNQTMVCGHQLRQT